MSFWTLIEVAGFIACWVGVPVAHRFEQRADEADLRAMWLSLPGAVE